MSYVGRFAPSPTGPLHAGSLVAALASWLDARAHGGRWIVRIDDADRTREAAGSAGTILAQLHALSLHADGPVHRTTDSDAAHAAAFGRLRAAGLAYACACTRKEIADSAAPRERHGELVYPGTCRPALPGDDPTSGLAPGRSPRAWRLRVPSPADMPRLPALGGMAHLPASAGLAHRPAPAGLPLRPAPAGLDPQAPGTVRWHDRRLGLRTEDVARDVGDFVLRRADGLWAYQLAIVVDDAADRVTDVVRGEDLAGSTARQVLLQRLLGLPEPRWLHLPVLLDAHGEKLSKQTGAPAVDTARPLATLRATAAALGLDDAAVRSAPSVPALLEAATAAWAARWLLR